MKYLSPCYLSQVVRDIQNSQVKAEELINQLCDLIDQWEPAVKAFIPEVGRRERLIDELNALYTEFPDPTQRPVLFGIPIGVKDIFNVDGFETRGGSNLPPELFAGSEADSVTKLKKAGALILGKTVTTEFAYFDPGPTGNPHNITHTPGGSSSGSAAAVAAGFTPLALGTQTIGSISRPASFCGVYGFKPSYNRISAKGVIPFSKSVDHIGFFTQDLEGLQLAASILVNDWHNIADTADSLEQPIIAIPKDKFLQQADVSILASFDRFKVTLQKCGYQILEINLFDNIEEINTAHKLINAYEFARVHQQWFSQYKDRYHQASIELIEKGLQINETDFQEALQFREATRKYVSTIQAEKNIDIWLSPSAPTTAPKGLNSTGNPIMNLPWTFLGLPTISIPYSLINELPFGIQLAGKFNQDEILFLQVKDVVNKCVNHRNQII